MFYIIEKVEQLERLGKKGEMYIDVVPYNYNFHPKLQEDKVSLVYLREPRKYEKGYIICVRHNESLSISLDTVRKFLKEKIEKLFVLDKKNFLYFFKLENVYDLNFVEILRGGTVIKSFPNKVVDHFYNKLPSNPELNCIIPISKHFEQKEEMFEYLQKNKLFEDPLLDTPEYKINNEGVTETFFGIENEGIKLHKEKFIEHYNQIIYPEYNISQGIIYTHYNLYNTTGRPSNAFNEINFSALPKDTGERESFQPRKGCKFVEFDVNGMHPRIIGGMVGFLFPRQQNVYDFLGIEKEKVFQNIYGGIKKEYRDKPFFKQIFEFNFRIWNEFKITGEYKSILRKFYRNKIDNPNKLFNYIVQSRETFFNISTITKINQYLTSKNKKTKIILTTYDSYLLNYDESDGVECLQNIRDILPKSKATSGEHYGKMQIVEF